MIRTAILAGILLIMLSMAINRPGNLPSPAAAVGPASRQEPMTNVPPLREARRIRPSAPVVHEDTAPNRDEEEITPNSVPGAASDGPIVTRPSVQTSAIATDAARPAPARLERRSTPGDLSGPAADVTVPVSEKIAVPEQQAKPASEALPEIHVPTRPVMVPQDVASRALPENGEANNSRESAPSLQVGGSQMPRIAPGTKFMTPEERSRELYRLAREMEDTFIQKLTQ